MPFQIGQAVGDYEVVGVLGSGGMGAIYKVRNRISDRVDAMKVLLQGAQVSTSPDSRFLREIRVHASLRHPHIAQLFTAFQFEGQLLMVMELVEGAALEDHLRSGPLPLESALSVLSQVLSALGYAHSLGVVHRDVKPANIIINPAGAVKLIDFGIAVAEFDPRITQAGLVLGSLSYMAPEQISGQGAGPRSDIYSAGVTLYQALTGRRPIQGATEYELMNAQVHQAPLPPEHWNSAIPPDLSAAILRALAKDPALRFQTAEEFRLALQPFLAPGDIAPLSPAAPALDEKVPSSSRFHSAALSILIRDLAHYIGPLARHLVLRASRDATNLEELCRTLAAAIPSESDRAMFLETCRRDLDARPTGAAPAAAYATTVKSTPPSGTSWDPALLERITKSLALHIGPLAKVIVARAAKKARSLDELGALVAAEINSPSDRASFLSSLPKP